MKKFYDPDFRLGILGGGQLGRMLIQAAVDMDIKTVILDRDNSMPAAGISHDLIPGSFTNYEDVVRLGEISDVITIEIENVNLEALKYLEAQGKLVFPQPRVIEIIKDKGLQKEFYRKNGIPTSDFVLTENLEDLKRKKDFLPGFHKLRTEGYDGRGVVRLKDESDLDKGFDKPALIEKEIDFSMEISVLVARGRNGEVSTFPAVGMEFHPEQNLVEYLYSPAGISEETEKEARELAVKVAEKLGITGILAVEMFLDKEGRLFVNESAPRPHNSGHHTIEGNYTSQYEQHLKAILGLPFGKTDIIKPAAMVNLIGEAGYSGKPIYEGIEKVLALPEVYIHLYGKQEVRPFRKMGHVTVLEENMEKLKEKVKFVKETLKVIA